MNHSKAITEFQLTCQRYYICYCLAAIGLEGHAEQLTKLAPDRTKTMFIGEGHPQDGKFHGSMNIGELLDSSRRHGAFADMIAQSFIVAMYTSWDELYRPAVAAEIGAGPKAVQSDLMGDLRLIRHCIVHKKSVISDEPEGIKELSWKLSPGKLVVSAAMFQDLIAQINHLAVRVVF